MLALDSPSNGYRGYPASASRKQDHRRMSYMIDTKKELDYLRTIGTEEQVKSLNRYARALSGCEFALKWGINSKGIATPIRIPNGFKIITSVKDPQEALVGLKERLRQANEVRSELLESLEPMETALEFTPDGPKKDTLTKHVERISTKLAETDASITKIEQSIEDCKAGRNARDDIEELKITDATWRIMCEGIEDFIARFLGHPELTMHVDGDPKKPVYLHYAYQLGDVRKEILASYDKRLKAAEKV